MQPQPTGLSPRLPALVGVKAVLFDIYGTLLVSGSGDIGTADEAAQANAMAAAWDDVGIPLSCSPQQATETFRKTIAAQHEQAKSKAVDFPEVNIIEVWRDVVGKLRKPARSDRPSREPDVAQLAANFEARANPVWPMPGLEACLARLQDKAMMLGVISNAQFFTVELFPALLGKSLGELGFDAQLCYFSYEHRRAKPSEVLFRLAKQRLATRGIQGSEVLYVGNDMRNDIAPAARVGFRTALFAGDARSLRLRAGDPSVAGVRPDAVVTELMQIVELSGD